MKHLILITALAAAPLAQAQYITYEHDAAKQNQITIAEIGSGSLTPALYYDLLHKSYAKTASEKNKTTFRYAAAVALYQQIDAATALDSALTKRAEVEALNIADRQIDLAWQVESNKLVTKLSEYSDNIGRITSAGGTAADQSYWAEYYNVYQSAITATKSGYMPNSQRKKQYLQIYADLTKKNEALLKYIVLLQTNKTTSKLLSATYTKPDNKSEIASAAASRWRTTSNTKTN